MNLRELATIEETLVPFAVVEVVVPSTIRAARVRAAIAEFDLLRRGRTDIDAGLDLVLLALADIGDRAGDLRDASELHIPNEPQSRARIFGQPVRCRPVPNRPVMYVLAFKKVATIELVILCSRGRCATIYRTLS